MGQVALTTILCSAIFAFGAVPVEPAEVAVELDRALRAGDAGTVARFIDVPDESRDRFSRAWSDVHREDDALQRVLLERFPAEARTLAERLKVGPIPSPAARERIDYVVRDGKAFPNPEPGVEYRIRAHTLRLRGDAWRVDFPNDPAALQLMMEQFETGAAELREKRRQVLESGKTAAQWLAETDPERGRAERRREAVAEQETERRRWLDEHRGAAAAADPGRLEGVILKLTYAATARDLDAAVSLAHVDGDHQAAVAKAFFERQFLVARLAEAAAGLDDGSVRVLYELGLVRPEDDPLSLQLTRWSIHRDVARGTIESRESPLRFRRIDGRWRLDLSRIAGNDPAAAVAEQRAAAEAARAGLTAISAKAVRSPAEFRRVMGEALRAHALPPR